MSEPIWQSATVLHVEPSAKHMVTLRVRPDRYTPHVAGQHYELRLPGNEQSRKYSVMSSPATQNMLEFGIRPYTDGAVSPRLQAMKPGDKIELRGPSGTGFLWMPAMAGPLILLGGGSGVTPLVAIHSHFRQTYPNGQAVFIVSTQTPEHLIRHLHTHPDVTARFTDADGYIDHDFLRRVIGSQAVNPSVRCYVCGPVGFIDAMVDYLLDLGFAPSSIVSEKFR